MFSQDDYRELSKYLKERAGDLKKEEKEKNGGGPPPNPGALTPGASSTEKTDSEILIAAARQLEVLRYDPMMVEALLGEYEVPLQVLEVPLDELPLHINDEGILTQTLAKWRFEKGV